MSDSTPLGARTWLALLLSGCLVVTPEEYADRVDPDHDGAEWPMDCDDGSSSVEGQSSLSVFDDQDGDGYGGEELTIDLAACPGDTGFRGYSTIGGDCNDGNPSIHPNAEEICNGVDDNCDSNAVDSDSVCRPGELILTSETSEVLTGGDEAQLGESLALLHDADGDPVWLAVGAPGARGEAPAFFLISFPLADSRQLGQTGDEAQGVFRVGTTQEGARLGASLLSVPDLDGDGVEELAFGAPAWDDGAEESGGMVSLQLSGSEIPANLLAGSGEPAVGPAGAMAGYALGLWEASGGEALLAVGAPGLADSGTGEAIGRGGLLFLEPSSLLNLDTGDDDLTSLESLTALTIMSDRDLQRAGSSVASGEDLTGDGLLDLVIGSSATDGRAWLLEGPIPTGSGAAILEDLALVSWVSATTELGASVAVSPDITGDGSADVLIGASGSSSGHPDHEGTVFVVAGGTGIGATGDLDERALTYLRGGVEGARLGSAILATEDLDGDAAGARDAQGRLDLVLGAPGADEHGDESGTVYVVFGPVSWGGDEISDVAELSRIGGPTPGDWAGSSLGGVPDPEREGYGLLLVGAPRAGVGDGSVHRVGVGL